MAADLRNADVYVSIFGRDQAGQKKTFAAITHAKSRIQAMLADEMDSKFCPVLRFYMDDKFKKTLETLKLIDRASGDRKKNLLNEEVPE